MNTKAILILLFSGLSLSSYSQSPMLQKAFGNGSPARATAIERTSDNGFIITGHDGLFWRDIFLIKTNNNGDSIWSKSYGNIQDEVANSVHQTSDGGYIISGSYIIKTDSLGDTLWVKSINVFGVIPTSDGGYIGISNFNTGAAFDVVKLNSYGNVVWAKRYDPVLGINATAIIQSTDGNFVISADYWPSNVYLIKIDTAGAILWSKRYDGNYLRNVKQTSDGGFIAVGDNSPTTGLPEVSVIKTDASGNLQWTKCYGTTDTERGFDIDIVNNSGYILCGSFQDSVNVYDILLIRIDINGNMLWTKKYGNNPESDSGLDVATTANNGFALLGIKFSATLQRCDFIMTDSSGNSGCNESVPNLIEWQPAVTSGSFSITVTNGTQTANPVPIGVQIYSPNFSTLCSSINSVEDGLSTADITIFPNPTSDYLIISFEKGSLKNTTCYITDMMGNLVLKQKLANKSSKLYLRNLSNGIYFAQLKSNEGIITKKIILSK